MDCSAAQGVFCVNLEFSHVTLDTLPCSCCQPAGPLAQPRQSCPVIPVHANLAELGNAKPQMVGPLLQRLFGVEGLLALFGRADVNGAKLVHGGGMNHVFMVAHAGRLVKCIRPQAEHFSEAQEAARLRCASPGLIADVHAVFPLASFVCQPIAPLWNQLPHEVVVFEYLDKCRSLRDVVRMFERTHPVGVLQSTAACTAHRSSGTCEHVLPLRSLVVQQVARIGRRFQFLYGRRHGDLKADNVLLDRRGVPRLADFLSPFCKTCDREEFTNSISSANPAVQTMRSAFDAAWHCELQRAGELVAYRCSSDCVTDAVDVGRNLHLLEALEQLMAQSKSNSLFGPLPSLLSGLQLCSPTPSTMPPTPGLPSPKLQVPSFSPPSLLECSPLARITPNVGLTPSFSGGGSPIIGHSDKNASFSFFGTSLAGSLEHTAFSTLQASAMTTCLPSPKRGLRSPASPVISAAERESVMNSRGKLQMASMGWPQPKPLATSAQSQNPAQAVGGDRTGAALWQSLSSRMANLGRASPARPFPQRHLERAVGLG